MRRSGYTLFELMLVIGLIVIATSIIVPAVDALLEPHKVQAAVDKVRAQWTETRTRAMAEGVPYRFSIRDNTGQYRIEPDDSSYEQQAEEWVLPEDCLFSADAASSGAAAAGGDWRAIAIFLPDGTAREDASLSFGVAGMTPITLRLRALTGTITSEEGQDGEAP